MEHCTRCDGTGKLTSITLGGTEAPTFTPAPTPQLDAFYFAENDYKEAVRLWPDATPILVFYWPSEADKASVAYKNLWERNTEGKHVIIPLCLSDQWDADTYVAQHWGRCTRQVVRILGDEVERITDLSQLEE